MRLLLGRACSVIVGLPKKKREEGCRKGIRQSGQRGLFLFFTLVILFLQAHPGAQLPPVQEDQGVTGLGLALRKLPTTGAVLMITAHPDDERNALLAHFSRGKGYRTGLMTLTRGDGGQNEIGSELFEALGVLRTEELLAVHRFDGVEQFFSRAFEFGYSFSVEETLEKWGKDEILSDIVRVIRTFRPHVILTLNPEGEGGGQHHQASARLAQQAFHVAADASQFPQQLEEGLRPWQPLRLFQLAGRRTEASEGDSVIRVSLGQYDPLLGETYHQFGARARSRHRSQGMNVLPQPGPAQVTLQLVEDRPDAGASVQEVFAGLPIELQSLTRYDADLESSLILLEGYTGWAREAYLRSDYEAAARAVMTGLEATRKLKKRTGSAEARFFLEQKEKDFFNAAAQSHFLYLDAVMPDSEDGLVVPEEEFPVEVRFYNHSRTATEILSVELEAPPDWQVRQIRAAPESYRFQVRVAPHPRYSQPFWYRSDPSVDRFEIEAGFESTQAVAPPPVTARVRYLSFGIEAEMETPVQFRWFDAAAGKERGMEVKVVPPVSVQLAPQLGIVSLDQIRPYTFEATVQSHLKEATRVSLRLQVPARWKVEPASADLQFQFENEKRSVAFRVVPPPGTKPGRYSVKAVAQSRGQVYDSGYQVISYPHIQPRHLYRESSSSLAAFPVRIPSDLKAGYIMGVGDDVGLYTEQLGASVHYLTAAGLAHADLSRYDVIITGVRAYLNRSDLRAYNQRLLDYVQNGGHLVVQYNKYEFLQAQYAPYPLTIDSPHDRVTVEDSPVKILAPQHPVFNWPNRIEAEDWNSWVQERGLYFLGSWDERYQPLLQLQDPWPYNHEPKQGSLVVARFGKGTYVYTGLAFFRQLPAGVPGAFRLWANLISLGRYSEE